MFDRNASKSTSCSHLNTCPTSLPLTPSRALSRATPVKARVTSPGIREVRQAGFRFKNSFLLTLNLSVNVDDMPERYGRFNQRDPYDRFTRNGSGTRIRPLNQGFRFPKAESNVKRRTYFWATIHSPWLDQFPYQHTPSDLKSFYFVSASILIANWFKKLFFFSLCTPHFFS